MLSLLRFSLVASHNQSGKLLRRYGQSCFRSCQWTLTIECAGQQSQQALQTYIGQIKEVMPNFGDGFLAAALQHFSYNSEQVIHTLLEGDLPPELKGLDPQMPLQAAGTTGTAGRGVAQPSSNGASLCGRYVLHCSSVYQGLPLQSAAVACKPVCEQVCMLQPSCSQAAACIFAPQTTTAAWNSSSFCCLEPITQLNHCLAVSSVW